MEYQEDLWIPRNFYDIQKTPGNTNKLIWNIKKPVWNTKKQLWNTKKSLIEQYVWNSNVRNSFHFIWEVNVYHLQVSVCHIRNDPNLWM